MQILLWAVAAVLVMAVIAVVARTRAQRSLPAAPAEAAASSTGAAPPAAASDVFHELRDRLLRATPEELGIDLGAEEEAWGVVMEIGYPEGVATVVALHDGNASLYLSTGGGVIGGVSHDAVRAAAVRFVEAVERDLSRFRALEDAPLPPPGRVRFVALTRAGPLMAEAPESELQRRERGLGRLYRYGQDVLTELRLVLERAESEKRDGQTGRS
jgi:hypothetical protein